MATAASLGDWEIKSIGHWKSNTYQTYIKEKPQIWRLTAPGGWHVPQHPSPSITADHIQLRTIYDGQFPQHFSSTQHSLGVTTGLCSEQTAD